MRLPKPGDKYRFYLKGIVITVDDVVLDPDYGEYLIYYHEGNSLFERMTPFKGFLLKVTSL